MLLVFVALHPLPIDLARLVEVAPQLQAHLPGHASWLICVCVYIYIYVCAYV